MESKSEPGVAPNHEAHIAQLDAYDAMYPIQSLLETSFQARIPSMRPGSCHRDACRWTCVKPVTLLAACLSAVLNMVSADPFLTLCYVSSLT